MGLKSIKNGLVPSRFMCMMAHMVILISVLINRVIKKIKNLHF